MQTSAGGLGWVWLGVVKCGVAGLFFDAFFGWKERLGGNNTHNTQGNLQKWRMAGDVVELGSVEVYLKYLNLYHHL